MELYPLWVLLIAAGVTLFTRALPFAVFGGKRSMPGAARYLGRVLPGAIIAILVIYCLKGLPAAGGMEAAFQLGALAVTAALHLWRRNTLWSFTAPRGSSSRRGWRGCARPCCPGCW